MERSPVGIVPPPQSLVATSTSARFSTRRQTKYTGRPASVISAPQPASPGCCQIVVPTTQATFPTTGLLFIGMVAAVIFVTGALTFLPFYALGPILEHLMLFQR